MVSDVPAAAACRKMSKSQCLEETGARRALQCAAFILHMT